jgi:uncharacterized protein YkwD
VPLAFSGNELPNPIPESKTQLVGYPITVTFPRDVRVSKGEGQLEDSAGNKVAVWVSTPDRPANPAHSDLQHNTLCLIARTLLQPATRYKVHFKALVQDQEWTATWSFTTASLAEARQQVEGDLLGPLNQYRVLAGCQPVALDPDRSGACFAHAEYLAKNLLAHPDLNFNEERRDLPGSSDEGQRIARVSNCYVGGGVSHAVESLLSTIYGRGFFLEPARKTLGLGYAPYGPRWIWMFTSGEGTQERRPEVVLFPADGQKDVPLLYPGHTNPNPIPPEAKGKEAGYLITATFPSGTPLAEATAQLMDGKGQPVSAWAFTPQMPPFPGWNQAEISLLPKAPLKEGTTYTAAFAAQVRGTSWKRSWTFATLRTTSEPPAEVLTEVLRKVNEQRKAAGLSPVEMDASLSRGCLLHARYVAANSDHPKVQGLGVHQEDSTLPGATPEGAQAARAAVIAQVSLPLEALSYWMGSFYHRIPILDPNLKRIGFAYAKLGKGHYVSVMDTGNGK